MALRVGQMNAAAQPAVLPEEQPPAAPPAPEEMAPDMPMNQPMEAGSVVEWLQEALDICKQYQCPDGLEEALEQALVLLIGPSAVGATEEVSAPAPAGGYEEETPAPEEEA